MQLDPEKLRGRLKPLLHENFEKLGELGAAISVWQNGKPVIDLYGGFCDAGREKPWTTDTLVLVWSATKGIGSACFGFGIRTSDFCNYNTPASLKLK